jgi:hypothetical protein
VRGLGLTTFAMCEKNSRKIADRRKIADKKNRRKIAEEK